ncbi:phage tail tape measure protein [uncultured Azonexus sp.]|uniref:phage tail tape measure protein n=1 Tax=uncultured Azonexus sp. TaxID=520307 RepID=UPI0026159998|nr:phage tail tape measure protein [uncultured Azonexus sp.]
MLGKMALAFTIGAAISDKHAPAVGKVQADFTKLGSAVKNLSAQSKGLERFDRARDAFLKAAAGASEAKAKLAALKAEYDKAPSDRLEKQVRKATDAFEAAKIKAFDKRKALTDLKKTLNEAGIATHKLADEKIRLGKALDESRSKLEKYNAVQSQRQRVGAAWEETKGSVAIGAAAAASFGAVVSKPVMNTAKHEDQIRQVAITGEFAGTEQEAQLGATVRRNAQLFNQTTEDINKGLQVLVAEGVDARKAGDMSAILAKGATATRASFEDLAKMTANFDKVLGVKDMELAYSQVAKAGKLGSFEIKDMAKWFPNLGGMMKSLGVTGNDAVVSMAARLQIAKMTAGSSDEAANNLKNFLAKLTSPDTQKDFGKLGIDLQKRMMGAAAKGLDPISAGVSTVMEQMAKKSPEAAAAMKKMAAEVAAIKDPAERAAELERRRGFIEKLGERAGIGKMFQDMQAVSYLLAEVQNQDKLKSITEQTKSGRSSSGAMTIDQDFADQMDLTTEKLKSSSIALSEFGKVVGTALMPAVRVAVDGFTTVVTGLSNLGKEFPKAAQAVVIGATLIGGGLVVGKLILAARSIVGLVSALRGLSAAQSALAGGGMISKLVSGFSRIGPAIGAVARTVMSYGPAIGSALSGVFRVLAFTPWGRAVSLIVMAGTLIWQNWDLIKSKASAVFSFVSGAFSSVVGWAGSIPSALASIGGAILGAMKSAFSWTPLGMIINNWGAITTFFQTMPSKFASFGAAIIDGLSAGFASKVESLKATVTGLGDSVAGWFKEKLGIRSPSRVFMGFGEMVGEGARLGIASTIGAVALAGSQLAGAAQSSLGAPQSPIAITRQAMPAGNQSNQPGQASGATPSVSITQTFHITQLAGEDSAALARRVAEMVKRETEGAKRAALGDWA